MIELEANYNLNHFLIFLKNDAMSPLLVLFFFSFFFVPGCLRFEEEEEEEDGCDEEEDADAPIFWNNCDILAFFRSSFSNCSASFLLDW